MSRINWNLIAVFMERRLFNGIPTKEEIVSKISKTSTRTTLPAGWNWR